MSEPAEALQGRDGFLTSLHGNGAKSVMTNISGGAQWPARLAYCAGALFSLASGITNLNYGWSKGADFASSLVWAGVAGAVAVVFALSWPALIRSLEAKRWSAAVVALVALILSGSYSITAALGSAAGGRTNAATAETVTTDARKKAHAAYDRADADLGKLAPARPVAEVEALLLGAQWWRPPKGCTADKGAQRVTCPALEAELARSRQRDKLKGEMDQAAGELKTIQPGKVANSDAKALARYLSAVGLEMTADRLNDLLVLLAVLTIEAGGGLSLALGMALSESVERSGQSERADGRGERSLNERRTERANERADYATPNASEPNGSSALTILTERPERSAHERVLSALRSKDGVLFGSQGALGRSFGWSKTRMNEVLHELQAAGRVRLSVSRRGTAVRLVARGAYRKVYGNTYLSPHPSLASDTIPPPLRPCWRRSEH
jgi:hypothetical protein